jgi:hypothetical protein
MAYTETSQTCQVGDWCVGLGWGFDELIVGCGSAFLIALAQVATSRYLGMLLTMIEIGKSENVNDRRN